MDYSNLSDFEINKRVAEALGIVISTRQTFISFDSIGTVFVCGETLQQYLWGEDNLHTKMVEIDYCNNWSDIGPIIEEYKIYIGPAGSGWFSVAVRTEENYSMAGENPKRAAAICFLMMKEKEQ